MKQILFITSGSIGDAVISTGILGWLMDKHPEARFTIAAGVASAPLFLSCPRVERVLPIRKQTYNRHWLSLWKDTKTIAWDMVVDLRGSLLSHLIPCKTRYVFHTPDKSLSKAEQLAALIGVSPPPPTRLWVSAEHRSKAQALIPPAPYYVIAPKTNSTAKDWPIERFAELAKKLYDGKKAFVVLATQEQRESVRPLIEALPAPHMVDLSGRTDLLTAIAVLEKSQMFIGNDSGLLHMAAALGIKSVGIYGPSNDKTYAPRAPHVAIITSHDFKAGEPEKRDNAYMQKIPVDTVLATALELQKA
jgi:lipopolysaccharide export system permease protein